MKAIKIFRILLLILIIIGIGLLLTQKIWLPRLVDKILLYQGATITMQTVSTDNTLPEVDTKEWLTYKNDKYGYQLKYPERATYTTTAIENSNDGNPDLIKFQLENAVGIDYMDEKRLTFIIGSFIQKDSQTLDEVVNDINSARQAPDPIIQKIIKIGGEDAYYLEYLPSGTFQRTDDYATFAIYFVHNGAEYIIRGFKIPGDITNALKNDPSFVFMKQYEPIFNAMLKSFYFY